ncbi:MAG: SGNH hydrolase domain-containing protein, partial [Actinomycetota bacterium]
PTITDRADRTPTLTTGTPTVTGTDPRTYNLADDTINSRDLLRSCFASRPERCILRRGTGPHLMLIGDSNAYALLPAFQQIAERNDLTLSAAVSGGCPWQRGLAAEPDANRAETNALFLRACPERQAKLYDQFLPFLQPDIVVAANVAYERNTPGHLHFANEGVSTAQTSPENDVRIRRATTASADAILANGAILVAIEPIPLPEDDFDPRKCLARATSTTECRYLTPTSATIVERTYRELHRSRQHFVALDLDRLVCPYLPICDPAINGRVVKGDHSHLTPTFAESLAPTIERLLRDRGVLPR